MLIQNSTAQAPQPVRISSESAPKVTPAEVHAQPATPQAVEKAVPATPQAAEKAVSAAQLQSAVQNANQVMQESSKDLAFSIDSDTKQTVVKLMDTKTGDIIGQFPTHQMLEISKAIGLMQEQLQQASITKAPVQSTQGMLIKQQA